MVLFGSFAKVTSGYLHGADPLLGQLGKRGKGLFPGAPLSQDFSEELSPSLLYLPAFSRGTLFLIYISFLILTLLHFGNKIYLLLWGLYNPKVGIIMEFRLVPVSVACSGLNWENVFPILVSLKIM